MSTILASKSLEESRRLRSMDDLSREQALLQRMWLGGNRRPGACWLRLCPERKRLTSQEVRPTVRLVPRQAVRHYAFWSLADPSEEHSEAASNLFPTLISG